MGKVYLTGHLEVPPDRIEAVTAALPAHIALTRAEPGCLAFSVAQSPDNPTHFLVSEIFANQSAFNAHQARTAASAWAKVTDGLLRHYFVRTE